MRTTKCGFDDQPGASGSSSLVLTGPTLIVDIGFDPNYDATNPASRPDLTQKGVWALVDTGATESCIDSGLAMQLNLPIIDRRKVGGISGVQEVNMHLGHVHIPLLNYTIYGAFAGVDLVAGGQAHFALIGRTFLKDFTMVYEGETGTVTLTYAR